MRLFVEIKTPKLPILYRHRVVSLLKEALKRTDRDYANFIYRVKLPKAFTFNLSIPPKREVKKEEIQIDERFIIEEAVFHFGENSHCRLFISSTDYRFLINLYNGLVKLKTFEFSSDTNMIVGGERLMWELGRIVPLKEKHIRGSRVVFKTASPIIVEGRDDIPITFEDDNFEKELNEIIDRKLLSLRGEGLKNKLNFKPIKMKKQVVKHTLMEFREKTGKPVMFLTANAGSFELSGNPKDLEFLYKAGIGNRTGQGFGMVEVVR